MEEGEYFGGGEGGGRREEIEWDGNAQLSEEVRKGGDEEARQWAVVLKDGYVAASSRLPKMEGRKVT